MSKPKRYSLEFRERAVCMLLDHKPDYEPEWSAMNAIAVKWGCTTKTTGAVGKAGREGPGYSRRGHQQEVDARSQGLWLP